MESNIDEYYTYQDKQALITPLIVGFNGTACDISHFTVGEFREDNYDGAIRIDHNLVDLLNVTRCISGYPIHINSGFRTPEHNEKIHGSPNSQHLSGRAADIYSQALNLRQLFTLLRGVYRLLNLEGYIIIYDHANFIHVDTRGKLGEYSMQPTGTMIKPNLTWY